MYVTGVNAPEQFHTVLQLSTEEAQGLAPPESNDDAAISLAKTSAVLDGVWSKFGTGQGGPNDAGQPANPNRVWDDTPLTFWGGIETYNLSGQQAVRPYGKNNIAEMLKTSHGSCGGWADLLNHCFNSQVQIGETRALLKWNQPVVEALIGPANQLQIAGNWGYLGVIAVFKNLPAQNNPNPKADFISRMIAQNQGVPPLPQGSIDPGHHELNYVESVGVLYDPSLGLRFEAAMNVPEPQRRQSLSDAWETSALSGWNYRVYRPGNVLQDLHNPHVPRDVNQSDQFIIPRA